MNEVRKGGLLTGGIKVKVKGRCKRQKVKERGLEGDRKGKSS